MSHVDGVDDGVGYGVSGTSSKGAGNGVYGESDTLVMVCMARAVRRWCEWH